MFQCEFIDLQNERKVLCSLKTQVLITKCKQYFLNYQSDFFFFFFSQQHIYRQKNPNLTKDGQVKKKKGLTTLDLVLVQPVLGNMSS